MAANSLSYQFKTATIAVKLIVITVVAFIVLNLIPSLFGSQFSLTEWLVLPDSISKLVTRPWTIITYAFMHAGFWHILWNMYFLYIFSRFILNLFTEERFLTIYVLGAITGGLAYLLSYNIFPELILKSGGDLRGASAAVNALIVFIATYSPNSPIRFFIFNFKLWHIAAFFVVSDLVGVATSSDNAGGLIAHLGGAAFGYVYAQQLAKGNDIGLWFEKMMDTVASWFSKTPRRTKSPLRTVHKKTQKTTNKKRGTAPSSSKPAKSSQQQQIDAILDKISKSGYDSLSKSEKDFLFKAGKED